MRSILLFFKNLHAACFEARIEWEIYNRLFPHLELKADYGYPFDTDAQLDELTASLDLQGKAAHVEATIDLMPKAFGQSFRYIMRRDLHPLLVSGDTARFEKRLRLYARLAPCRVQPETCDPRFVARAA